ncbi:hypothetical protein TAMA11512_20250 [Selenomonas sp. TAMA-11512]|nr:hypothetical protein TAMA11512_20250 [Selenomonas sp. TAMA-11512]
MLHVKKSVVGSLEKCYALAELRYRGREHFLCASEQAKPCYLISPDGVIEETVWEGPGGVMTMRQIPGTDGQFLATRKFYSPDASKEASIVVVTPKGKNDWEMRTLVDLPFVHRFDILERGGRHYLIACALKSGHEFPGDWRFPGRVFAAELPADFSVFDDAHQLELTVLKEGLTKNHGYCRHAEDDGTSSIVSADNGVFQFRPPETAGGAWEIETLTTDAASDALLLDLNGDGAEELCAIAPFHGDTIRVYERKGGKFEIAYEHPERLKFLHAIFGGEIAGRNTWVLGSRQDDMRLLAFTYENGKYEAQELDRGCGAANVLHFVRGGKDIIAAANRETDEIALYELTRVIRKHG